MVTKPLICRFCRQEIADASDACFESHKTYTGVYHQACLDEIEERKEAISKTIDSFDKLTQVSVSFDTQAMAEDGVLNDPADYSDEKFFAMIEGQMRESNADTKTITLSLMHDGKVTGQKATLAIERENGKFFYDYRGAIRPYVKSFGWPWRKRMRLWLYYSVNYKGIREILKQDVRELFWKCLPDWDKLKD